MLLDGEKIYEKHGGEAADSGDSGRLVLFPQASIAETAKLYAGMYPTFNWDRYHRMREVFPLNESR